MKFGSFLLGTLTGAAVVMLMQNKKVTAVAGDVGQMFRQRMNQVKETAIGKGLDVQFAGGMLRNIEAASSTDQTSGGLEQVEEMVSRDPQVKQEVNEILSENDQQQLS